MNCKDIDILLFRLIKKYDIYKYIPEEEAVYCKQLSWQLLSERIESIPDGKVVALRGAGVHSYEFLNHLSDKAKKKITYVIDKDLYKEVNKLETIHPKYLKKYHVDVVVISSFRYKAEFIKELLDNNDEIEIIEPYDYLNSLGIHYSQELYEKEKVEPTYITYMDVNNSLGLYQREKNLTMQRYYLEKLVAQCVEIKDFISADKYIDEYIENGWDELNRYHDFRQELSVLLETIKNMAQQREQKDIVINWIDDAGAEEFYATEFAKKRKEDSCIFTQAYTVSPWTHITLLTLFTGKLTIDDKVYKELFKKITEENSPVLKMLNDADYQFNYIRHGNRYKYLFADGELSTYSFESFEKIILGDSPSSGCSTRLQWCSLRLRLLSEKPVFHLIHNLAEPHEPYIYTGSLFMAENESERRQKGIEFIAEQLDWYSKFEVKKGTQIYLSDHGGGRERYYVKRKTNVVFMVKSPAVKQKIENRLYSHQNFYKVIRAVLSEKQQDWEDCFSEYILYQNIDFYNKYSVEQALLGFVSQKFTPRAYQFRGIRTKEDLLIIYATGKELYFRLPDEENNLIKDENWQERIAKLRELCGDYFIDISNEPLFEHSQLLYNYIKYVQEQVLYW